MLIDHLGSTRIAVDEDGSIVENVWYLAYGAISGSDNGDPVTFVSSEKVKEKFTGKEFDQEGATANGGTGINLDYFGARYYDPEVGLWTSADPHEQFWSSYSYGINPINAIDPYGLDMFVVNADNPGDIIKVPEEGSSNNYYIIMSGGKVVSEYYLDLTSSGLVEFPASGAKWGRYGTEDAGGDHYITGGMAAALLGLLHSYSDSKVFNISFGDMSTSSGGAPGGDHKMHGGSSGYSGVSVDYRYLSHGYISYQGNSTSAKFDARLNADFLYNAGRWGFNKNYASNQDVWGSFNINATKIGGHNDHGHLTYTP